MKCNTFALKEQKQNESKAVDELNTYQVLVFCGFNYEMNSYFTINQFKISLKYS